MSQRLLPVLLVGAGLPQLRGQMRRAKSYTERMFGFPEIGPLDGESARQAIAIPIKQQGVSIEGRVLDRIVEVTHGYPYFLQEWGMHSWELADAWPITEDDVKAASVSAIAALDESFFRVRFDRLTPTERRYLRAMAELGPDPHRSGDIAAKLRRGVTSLAPARAQLIAKGMIWSRHMVIRHSPYRSSMNSCAASCRTTIRRPSSVR